MNLKLFILGLCVLVSIAQISTAQSQESQQDESDGREQESEPEDQMDEEIEQRRKITNVMNSAVNIIDQPDTHQQEITQVQTQQNTGFMGLPSLPSLPSILPGVLPNLLGLIPALIEGLWRVWRSLRYVVLYPVRTFKRWLQRIVRLLYGVPRYLGAILRGSVHLLFSPLGIFGFMFKRGFIAFNDYVIIPVARLKYFLINLFDVLLGPLNITRHFLEELACLFIKTPLRVIRSVMRAFFVNGILNTIRYIKTVIYEIIVFPWSHHYADMFPSLGNRHNYILANGIVCQGKTC